MVGFHEVLIVSLLGLLTTSSSMVGAALGLYVPLSKRLLACVLAFAAGALISALAIELAYEGAQELHRQGFGSNGALIFIGSGFALGSVIYYAAALFLDQKGAAIRYPTRFREYALGRKQKDAKETIRLLSKCDLLRHLPAEEVERIRRLSASAIWTMASFYSTRATLETRSTCSSGQATRRSASTLCGRACWLLESWRRPSARYLSVRDRTWPFSFKHWLAAPCSHWSRMR